MTGIDLQSETSDPAPGAEPRRAKSRPVEFGDLRAGTIQGRWFHIVQFVLSTVLKILLGYRVEGRERVPRTGPLVVVSNHVHNGDPMALAVAIPRPLHFMAKRELFAIPMIQWIIRGFGTFPVDRGKGDRWAIRRAEATLGQGIALAMFPEGTRSKVAAIQPPLPGAALIALRSGAPVLPVGVTGTEYLPFRGRHENTSATRPWRRLRPRMHVVIGEPFALPRETNGKRVTSAEATELMMIAVARLLPSEYRGVYSAAVDEPADAASVRGLS